MHLKCLSQLTVSFQTVTVVPGVVMLFLLLLSFPHFFPAVRESLHAGQLHGTLSQASSYPWEPCVFPQGLRDRRLVE